MKGKGKRDERIWGSQGGKPTPKEAFEMGRRIGEQVGTVSEECKGG